MYSPTPPPPLPPPKPSSHDTSRLGTPTTMQSPRLTPDSGLVGVEGKGKGKGPAVESSGLIPASRHQQPQQQAPPEIPDPGEQWLPKFLEDKSKQDLAEILSQPNLLTALTHAPQTIHPSLQQSHDQLQTALTDNVSLAAHLSDLEARLGHGRSAAQAQLLSTHALERAWRAKQGEMDDALAPFAPAALYGRLTAALQEQELVCGALEESFLDGGGGRGHEDEAPATEREVLDWVRRYREAKKLFYLRQERKERWNERRVGGWR